MRIVALLLLSLCTIQASATDKIANGKTITTEKGDVIVFSATTTKELHIANTNEQRTVEYGQPKPILLNGKEIYYIKDRKTDTVNNFRNGQIWVADHVNACNVFDKEIKKEKKQLATGSYEIVFKDVVINEQGKIVYFRTEGIVRRKHIDRQHVKPAMLPLSDNIAKAINNKLTHSIGKLEYTPLMIAGNATPYYNYLTYSFDID